MRRRRAHEARSDADRDLQRHVGQAEKAIRAALDVCARASRRVAGAGALFHDRGRVLQQAQAHLAAIGHLEDLPPEERDLRNEARDLLSWMENRERLRGARKVGRRGREYQDRLMAVSKMLVNMKSGKMPEAESLETAPVSGEAVPVSGGPVDALRAMQAMGVTDGP